MKRTLPGGELEIPTIFNEFMLELMRIEKISFYYRNLRLTSSISITVCDCRVATTITFMLISQFGYLSVELGGKLRSKGYVTLLADVVGFRDEP